VATISKWKGKELTELTRRRVHTVLRATGMQMVRDVKTSMTETPPGTKKGPMRTRSRPKQPPAVQYGHLRASIEMDASDLDAEDVVYVGATGAAPYAFYLEMGTPNMLARPFLRPVLDRVKQPLQETLKGILP